MNEQEYGDIICEPSPIALCINLDAEPKYQGHGNAYDDVHIISGGKTYSLKKILAFLDASANGALSE